MTNRLSVESAPDGSAERPFPAGEAPASDDSFRRVANMLENRTRSLGAADVWSEPDVKQSPDAEQEREAAAAGAALEDQEGIDDPVRMYLREIGKVFLLSAADEKRLARQREQEAFCALQK